jgi:hypothetical protein
MQRKLCIDFCLQRTPKFFFIPLLILFNYSHYNLINEYNGGVVIITHDKYLIEKINDYKLLILKDKHITEYNGGFEEYCKNFIDSDDDE